MATTARAGKLDTSVNGPHGDELGWDLQSGLEWDAVPWHSVEDDVRRLRQRIFKASQAGDLKRVRGLQKLMLRSRSNTLHSVRRVTQLNAGRKTPGVDGQVALTSLDRAEVAVAVHRHLTSWQARPVKRVFIAESERQTATSGDPELLT